MRLYSVSLRRVAFLSLLVWLLVLLVLVAPVAPANGALDAEQRRNAAVIREVFGPRGDFAVCIAWHESRLRRRAVGREGERGLLQIHPVHFRWAKPHRLFGARWNALVAYRLSKRGTDWRPWTTRGMC